MFNKKNLLALFFSVAIISLISCGKTKTVITDFYLIENPGEKKVKYINNGKVKRGEYLKVIESKAFEGKNYFFVQI